MFEVGFSEIVLIMLIALIVLGPEKLPKLAADVGRWVGRARAMARQLRSQLDQEVQLDEMLRDKPATPSYPPPTGTTPPYGAAGAAAASSTTDAGAATDAAAASASAAAPHAPGDVPAEGSTPLPGDTPAAAANAAGAPTSREAAYADYVARTQAAYQNPPAVGPGAPDIGAPTDEVHSHGEAPADPHSDPHSDPHAHSAPPQHDDTHGPRQS